MRFMMHTVSYRHLRMRVSNIRLYAEVYRGADTESGAR